ncbi:MAG: glycosyltransferase [Odoribacter sp.]|nr:glycosyltransferase [Odoribacter sp.]
MKKLLQINTVVGWSAPGIIVSDIADMSRSRGYESFVAYGRDGHVLPRSGNMFRIDSLLDLSVHGLATRLFDSHGLASRHATRRLIAYISTLRPDVIHLHNIHGYYLNYRLLFDFLKSYGCPVVWTLHDVWPITGHCAFYPHNDCDRWLTGCHDCSQRSEYPSSLLLDRSERNFAFKKKCFTDVQNLHIVTVSNYLRDIIRNSFLRDYPLEVIHNGVILPPRLPDGRMNNAVVLGAANKWDKNKGLENFIHLRKLLPEKVKIVLLGLSRKQIASLPLGITGYERVISRDALVDFYKQASVVACLSKSETLGMTSIEAQAAGTPVVAFAVGGLPETLTPETGIAVSPGDIEAAAAAINEVIENPDRFSPQACRANVQTRFNLYTNYARYFELYDRLTCTNALK